MCTIAAQSVPPAMRRAAWADCTAACEKLGVSGSWDFAFEIMKRAHVAVTPGRDFGAADTARFVAGLRGVSPEALAETTTRNFARLFTKAGL